MGAVPYGSIESSLFVIPYNNSWGANQATGEAPTKPSRRRLPAQNRESIARSGRLEAFDDLGRDRARPHPGRVVLVGRGPHARLAPLHGEIAAHQHPVLH